MITATYKVTNTQTIYNFLEKLNIYPQSYRIKVLLECGGVKRKPRGYPSEIPCKYSYEIVERGDEVSIEITSTSSCEATLESTRISDSEFRDYAFTPGGSGGEELAKNFFRIQKPVTIVIEDPQLTLSDFLQTLENNDKITHPIRNILLCTHATPFGLMLKLANDVKLEEGESAGVMSYEQLEKEENKKKISIPKSSLSPRPSDKKYLASLKIKGCNIGKAQEYLLKLKEALGDQITSITAPMHANYFGDYNTIDKSHPGFHEWLCREFTINRPTPFRNYRTDVIGEFASKKFDIYDRMVKDEMWDEWFPPVANVNMSHNYYVKCISDVTKSTIDLKIDRMWQVDIIDSKKTIPCPKKPASPKENEKVVRSYYSKLPTCSPDHKYPLYKRFGHETLDEWLDSYTFSGFDWENGKLSYKFKRFTYTLSVPITNKEGILLHNFYPKGIFGKPFNRLDEKEKDTRLFATV